MSKIQDGDIGRCLVMSIIEDGSWLTGSSNNFAAVADRHVVPKTI